MVHFTDIADRLIARGLSVGWCCGPAEEAFNDLDPQLPSISLVELAPLLASAKLYIGNDSGITHLASVAGCPTVAVFGPTNPRVWQPIGPRTIVIQGTPWPDPGLVFDAVERFVSRCDK